MCRQGLTVEVLSGTCVAQLSGKNIAVPAGIFLRNLRNLWIIGFEELSADFEDDTDSETRLTGTWKNAASASCGTLTTSWFVEM